MNKEHKGRIFWIDDEIPTAMKFLITGIELAGYDIDTALYIKDSLERLDEYSKGRPKPDVIILDIMMPIRDEDHEAYDKLTSSSKSSLENGMKAGLALISRIKEILPNVPIIVLTNLSEETEIGHYVFDKLRKELKVKKSQVKKNLSKPQQLEVLTDIIAKAIAGEL